MIISFIVAMAQNRVIGLNQNLPWNIPTDLKRFKKITSGHVVIMGRKSFDAIGKPLPNRENVVITRQKNLQISGARVVPSLDEALNPYRSTEKEIFILGGGQIFSEALPIADRIYLTLIEKDYEGDAYFPEADWTIFEKTFEESHSDPVPFKFIDYQRKNK
jgi:dihydrofolate reductase